MDAQCGKTEKKRKLAIKLIFLRLENDKFVIAQKLLHQSQSRRKLR